MKEPTRINLCKEATTTTCGRFTVRFVPALFLSALLAMAPAAAFGQADVRKTMGEWAPKFEWPNVPIHVHVLPNGKILFWGRREKGAGLDPRNCIPRLWDPKEADPKKAFKDLAKPGFNLFCSGHTFLPDGRLLVVGGHIGDGHGEPLATLYDPENETWTRIDDMNGGRWYPTAVTLPDGSALASFGSDQPGRLNDSQQVGQDGHWRNIVNFNAPPLYPRMHVAPDGRVFMSGPLELTQFLDTSGGGAWQLLNPDQNKSNRINGLRDYAPSVMYDAGKILFVGGGNPPTNAAEIIDLKKATPAWQKTAAMRFARRQHNATILPDGTVLVTGGTQGNGGPNNGFNDLRIGQPIRAAELWNPENNQWTVLAEEGVDRCYHSTAVLLPDATVLSGGGGEYRPQDGDPRENAPEDSHRDAQIFSPPYLFTGTTRPDITSAPGEVAYGQSFNVRVSQPDQVALVTWIRLSTVTHSFNQGQRFNKLEFTSDGTKLAITAPANRNVCPPGHYMLFVLSKEKVPSVARIIRIHEP